MPPTPRRHAAPQALPGPVTPAVAYPEDAGGSLTGSGSSHARGGELRLRALAELASRQHGVIARRQVVALGFGRRAIERLVATGRLHPVHRGVYLVGHRAPAPRALDQAALLAAGDGALLSHATAGARCGFVRKAPSSVELTVVGRAPVRPGLTVHRVAAIVAREITRDADGLAVTAPARTLLDLAPRLDVRALAWGIEEGRARGLVTATEIASVLERHRGRRGAPRLRAALERVAGEPLVTRSEAERRLLDIVAEAGLPRPRANDRVAGWSVDAHWPAQGLVVEVDGFAYHGSRTAFERDRRKDAALLAAGLRVARLSWHQITGERLAVAALLARLLTGD